MPPADLSVSGPVNCEGKHVCHDKYIPHFILMQLSIK